VRNAICRRFCPSWAPKPAVQTVKAGDIVMGADGDLVKDVTVAPRLQKNLTVAYWLWQCLGLVGAHHFYLGRISQGLVWAFSLGMFGFGWLIDGAFLKKYTEWANKVRAGAVARGRGHGWERKRRERERGRELGEECRRKRVGFVSTWFSVCVCARGGGGGGSGVRGVLDYKCWMLTHPWRNLCASLCTLVNVFILPSIDGRRTISTLCARGCICLALRARAAGW
jgi:TM2 domain-containing membrane protein YozV